MLVFKQLGKTLIVAQTNRFAGLSKISAGNKILTRSIDYPFKERKFSAQKIATLRWKAFIDKIEALKCKSIRVSYLKIWQLIIVLNNHNRTKNNRSITFSVQSISLSIYC